jgi:hypothetical protein
VEVTAQRHQCGTPLLDLCFQIVVCHVSPFLRFVLWLVSSLTRHI